MPQEFDNNVLYLVKQKGVYPYKYLNDFEKLKEELPSKEKFYSSLTGRKITDKENEHVWNKFEIKKNERLSRLVFKIWRFIISWCIWEI